MSEEGRDVLNDQSPENVGPDNLRQDTRSSGDTLASGTSQEVREDIEFRGVKISKIHVASYHPGDIEAHGLGPVVGTVLSSTLQRLHNFVADNRESAHAGLGEFVTAMTQLTDLMHIASADITSKRTATDSLELIQAIDSLRLPTEKFLASLKTLESFPPEELGFRDWRAVRHEAVELRMRYEKFLDSNKDSLKSKVGG